MTAELNALRALAGNVGKTVQDNKNKIRISKKTKNKLNRIGKSNSKSKKDTKEEAPAAAEEQEPTAPQNEPSNKVEESKQPVRAYQPMLPGMRGTVERVKVDRPKVSSAPTSAPNYTQLAFPGMSVASIKNPKPNNATGSEENDIVVGGSDGIDWASMPPVDLTRIDNPMRGRQFGA